MAFSLVCTAKAKLFQRFRTALANTYMSTLSLEFYSDLNPLCGTIADFVKLLLGSSFIWWVRIIWE